MTLPAGGTTFPYSQRHLVEMNRLLRFLVCGWALAAVATAWTQEVDVALVRFTMLRAPLGSTGNWLEAEVQLNARPAPGSPGPMVSRVRVAVLLGYELPAAAGAERRVEHYRAEAECVALEPGRSSVRFYLPPEVVKRDNLRSDAKYWTVDLSIGGRPVPPGRSSASSALSAPEARRNFQTRGNAAAANNDGILLPQFLSPFAAEYPRATPSFVRRDAR